MNISILIPTRNNLEFLKLAYNSIRKSQGDHIVEILVLDDKSDLDETWEWLQDQCFLDINLKIFQNKREERLGISGGYKFLAQQATQEILCHFHADMFMTPGTLDGIENCLFDFQRNSKRESALNCPFLEKVVCLTRIEPPIYSKSGLYPEKIIWSEAPIELEDWDENKFLEYLPEAKKLWNGRTTGGHFAPFFMIRDEYLRLGGNDIETFPLQSREDSDWAFRLVLAGFKTIQIPCFVYHFASRGNRRSKHNEGSFKDDPKWTDHNIKATRNFIRKWGTLNLHDEYLKPISPKKFNIGFVLTSASSNLLYNLEPWCDHIQVDLEREIVDRYIEFEQFNTNFNLRERINSVKNIPEIVVEMDARKLTNDDFLILQNLGEILSEHNELGEFELGNLQFNIKALNRYENDLIVCKNEPIKLV